VFALKDPKRPTAFGWVEDRQFRERQPEDEDALRATRMWRRGLLRVSSSYGRLEVAGDAPVMAYFVRVSDRGHAAAPEDIEDALEAFGMQDAHLTHESSRSTIFALVDREGQTTAEVS